MKQFYGLLSICLLLFIASCAQKEPAKPIRSAEIWPDDRGVHVNAHGGGMLYHDGTYYWYGENKSDTTSKAMVGIMCYSSKISPTGRTKGPYCPSS